MNDFLHRGLHPDNLFYIYSRGMWKIRRMERTCPSIPEMAIGKEGVDSRLPWVNSFYSPPDQAIKQTPQENPEHQSAYTTAEMTGDSCPGKALTQPQNRISYRFWSNAASSVSLNSPLFASTDFLHWTKIQEWNPITAESALPLRAPSYRGSCDFIAFWFYSGIFMAYKE